MSLASYAGFGAINSRAVTWKFRVTMPGLSETAAEFLSVSGLDVERETSTINVGGKNDGTVTLPGRIKYSNITLERGLIDLKMLEWLMKHVDAGRIMPEPLDFTIELATESNKVAYRWDVSQAWPVKWTGPSLKADSAEIAVESVELAHLGFKLTVPSGL